MYYRTSENKGVSSLVALGLWTIKTNKYTGKMSFFRLRLLAKTMLYAKFRTLTQTL